MEKYIVWYRLCLKIYAKKKIYWLQLIGMAATFLIIAFISFPNKDNLSVGIYCEGEKYSKQLTKYLLEEQSIFVFNEYENKEQLYEDVLAGKIECGFLFDKNLDRKIEKGELKKSITYVGNSFSVKGETVQETVYAALFKIYSDELLKQNEKSIYGDNNKERIQKLIEKNHEYQISDVVFRLDIKTVDLNQEEDIKNDKFFETYPLKGMVGIFIFFVMFMSYGNRYTEHGKKIENALCAGERLGYVCINQLAAGTIPLIAGIIVIYLFMNPVNMVIEIFGIVGFLIVSSIWIGILGNFFKTGSSFTGAIISVLLINLLACPVFINFETYVPAIQYIRLLFPLGWYLK